MINIEQSYMKWNSEYSINQFKIWVQVWIEKPSTGIIIAVI